MTDDGYRYDLDQCDVPKERRSTLRRFREKRREWLSWLDTDEYHAIWPTLQAMVWADVAFNALRRFAEDNDENALSNPLIVEAVANDPSLCLGVALQLFRLARTSGSNLTLDARA